MENGNNCVRGLKYIEGDLQKKEGGKTVRIVEVFHFYFHLYFFSLFKLHRSLVVVNLKCRKVVVVISGKLYYKVS